MVKSPFPDVTVPATHVYEAFHHSAERHSDRTALVMVDGETERQYTYHELDQKVRSIASALTKLGLRQRDIVAFFAPNSPDYVFMFYAVIACGATVSTINPVYTVYEVSKHLQDSKPQFVFTSPEGVHTARQAADKAALRLKSTIVSGSSAPGGCVALDQLIADDGSRFPAGRLSINPKDDIAVIPYSSGTSGFPKGVLITHYNLIAMIQQIAQPNIVPDITPSRPGEQQQANVTFLPFFHAYGLVVNVLGSLLAGNKLVVMNRFDPQRFLAAIQKHRPRRLLLLPPVVLFLTQSTLVKQYDLSSVEGVTSGAAPLSKDVEERFIRLLNIPEIRQGYGMTETTVCCCYQPTNLPPKAGSIGVPVPNCEVQIVDPASGRVLGAGERGEVWVKGPNVTRGYLNRPEATREALTQDGWLRTGDVGYYDSDGYFFIVDRIKELIKYKGFQVAPAELEGLLLNHPQIDDVAVIGVPDKEAGELPKAYVVSKPGTNLTEAEVKKYVAGQVSSFKHLRGGVQFVSSVPKSASGKILRRQLRDQLKTSKI